MASNSSNVTLQDIARHADLSVSAVSMALAGYPDISPATRMRVRELSRQLNYKPRRRRVSSRRGLADNRVRRIGLVLVGYDTEPSYLITLLRVLSDEGAHANCKMEVAAIPEAPDTEQALRFDQIARDVDGLLIDGYVRPALFDHTSTLAVPSVVMGNVYGDPLTQAYRGYQVTVDAREMGQLATRTLIEAGHRRIAFLSRPLFENLWFERWYQGYRHAHVEAGLSIDPALVKIVEATDMEHGVVAARELLNQGELPTGYVVPNPLVAAQALATLNAAGFVIPSQDMVIGATTEGARERHVEDYPRISSNPDRLARASLELLLRAMDGPPPEPCKLIVPFDLHNLPTAASSNRSDSQNTSR